MASTSGRGFLDHQPGQEFLRGNPVRIVLIVPGAVKG
jgi:hypothetical protein